MLFARDRGFFAAIQTVDLKLDPVDLGWITGGCFDADQRKVREGGRHLLGIGDQSAGAHGDFGGDELMHIGCRGCDSRRGNE